MCLASRHNQTLAVTPKSAISFRMVFEMHELGQKFGLSAVSFELSVVNSECFGRLSFVLLQLDVFDDGKLFEKRLLVPALLFLLLQTGNNTVHNRFDPCIFIK